jgi:hypothetical protein
MQSCDYLVEDLQLQSTVCCDRTKSGQIQSPGLMTLTHSQSVCSEWCRKCHISFIYGVVYHKHRITNDHWR